MVALKEIPKIPLKEKYAYVIWDHKMAMEVIRAKLYQKGVDPKLIEDLYDEVYTEGGVAFVKEWKDKFGLGVDPGSAAILGYIATDMWDFPGHKLLEANEKRGHLLVCTKCPAWEAIKQLGMEKTFNCLSMCNKWATGFVKALNPKLKLSYPKPRIPEGGDACELLIEWE